MKLLLIRHGPAEPGNPSLWPDDSWRPLTNRGIRKLRKAARGLARLVPEVDRLVASPFPRASQSAEILSKVAGWPAPKLCAELAAGADPETMLNAILDGRQWNVCVGVGHEPDLSLAVATLVGMQPRKRSALRLKKGGVASRGVWFAGRLVTSSTR